MHKKEIKILSTIDIISSELSKLHKSQKDLCDYLGLKQQAYSDWKSGKSESYKKYLNNIAEFLDVPINYLLGKDQDSIISHPIQDAYDKAPEDIQRAVRKLLDL